MSTGYRLILTSEQSKALLKFLQTIVRSRFNDPENLPTAHEILTARSRGVSYHRDRAFDLSNATTCAGFEWEYYLVNVGYEASTERASSPKRVDTAKKRLKAASKLKKILGHWPTAADLQATFFDLPKPDNSIVRVVDRDLEHLKSLLPQKPEVGRLTKSPTVRRRRF